MNTSSRRKISILRRDICFGVKKVLDKCLGMCIGRPERGVEGV